ERGDEAGAAEVRLVVVIGRVDPARGERVRRGGARRRHVASLAGEEFGDRRSFHAPAPCLIQAFRMRAACSSSKSTSFCSFWRAPCSRRSRSASRKVSRLSLELSNRLSSPPIAPIAAVSGGSSPQALRISN